MAFRADLFRKHSTDGTKFWTPAMFITTSLVIPGAIGCAIAGILSGIGTIPTLIGFSAATAGMLGSSYLSSTKGMIERQLKVEDKLENATKKVTGSVSNLIQAAQRRKAINDSLESFILDGIKADYKVIFDTEEEDSNNIFKGFLIRIHGTKDWSNKTCLLINENVFNSCFQIDSADKCGIVNDEPDNKQTNSKELNKDVQDILVKIINKYGMQGTCTLIEGAKMFVTDNAVKNNGEKYALFLETPGTKKPNLSNPIFISNKDALTDAVATAKK